MNFFRSEDHLRNWEGFKKRREGGIIDLNASMQLFSRPYFTNRMKPDYFSHMGEYLSDMIDALETLENAGSYWRVNRVEKLGFSVGQKLGLV